MKRIGMGLCLGLVAVLLGCAQDQPAEQGDQMSTSQQKTMTVTAKGKPLNLGGPVPRVGERAPAFAAVANDMSTFQFQPGSGQVYIVAAVPSLDTSVCSTETRRFNQEAASLGTDVRIITISMDLPFAQKRWCGAEGVQRLQTVSDYRDRDFGQRYGVRIQQTGLLARSVFVVDRAGKITYEQVVAEQSSEPDYAAALDAARAAEAGGH